MPVLSNAWISRLPQAQPEPDVAPEPSPAPTPAPAPSPDLVNVNTAGITQLRSLTGIGDASAKRIIAAREQSPIVDLADLIERAELGHITDTESLDAAIAF